MNAQEKALFFGVSELLGVNDIAVQAQKPACHAMDDAYAVGARQGKDEIVHGQAKMAWSGKPHAGLMIRQGLIRRSQVKVARMVHQWLVKGTPAALDLTYEQNVIAGVVAADVIALKPGGAVCGFKHRNTTWRAGKLHPRKSLGLRAAGELSGQRQLGG